MRGGFVGGLGLCSRGGKEDCMRFSLVLGGKYMLIFWMSVCFRHYSTPR